MATMTGTVTMKGDPVELVGTLPTVGDKAADFVAVGNDLKEVRLSDFRGKVVVLLSVPSLDTSVCSIETRRFNEEARRLGKNVAMLAVSMDLPFAQKRWCLAEGVNAVTTASDHRDASFGKTYGLLMKDLRLLARAVFVIDPAGTIRYVELVKEVSNPPDYEAALRAVAEVSK
jgi:thiol peroxidase